MMRWKPEFINNHVSLSYVVQCNIDIRVTRTKSINVVDFPRLTHRQQ